MDLAQFLDWYLRQDGDVGAIFPENWEFVFQSEVVDQFVGYRFLLASVVLGELLQAENVVIVAFLDDFVDWGGDLGVTVGISFACCARTAPHVPWQNLKRIDVQAVPPAQQESKEDQHEEWASLHF